MKPARPIPPPAPRQPESFPGAPDRLCGNCAHFDSGGRKKNGSPARKDGVCRNGISGRIKTTISHGCGHGFYPCTIRWPLKAGPGGVR